VSRRTTKIAGCTLIAAASIGFLTVADELRHTGELSAVLGVLLSGVALLAAGLFPEIASVLALKWVPVGIAAGALAGAVADRVEIGVAVGVALGVLLAWLRRTRPA
jgi:hypothetical protein